jgi:biotin carboxyl carrier protein
METFIMTKKWITFALSLSLSAFACTPKESSTAETPSATKTKAPAPKTVNEAPKAAEKKADPAPAPASTEKRRVFFVSPANGAKVKSPLKVTFGLEGMGIRPAGQDLKDKTTGHHHLIIDGASIAEGQVVPMNETHKHFGKGQTETTVELTKGTHSLTMQLADGAHISYGASMSETIEVVVE